jgi:SPP1 gp7 family putative phage head morphogenesis protein
MIHVISRDKLAESLALTRAPVDPLASAEAVAWFRARVPVLPATWRALNERQRRRAFTVAGAESVSVLARVWRSIDRAVAEGTRFIDFKRDVGTALRDAWAGTSPPRLNVVFRNNVQVAYAAGRYAQMTDPDVLRDRPVWRFDAILDSRTTNICQPLNGRVLLASDPWWRSHYPPLHHQCRSGVVTLTPAQAREETEPDTSDAHEPQPGWGLTPDAAEWSPDPNDYPEPLRPLLARAIAPEA